MVCGLSVASFPKAPAIDHANFKFRRWILDAEINQRRGYAGFPAFSCDLYRAAFAPAEIQQRFSGSPLGTGANEIPF